MNVGQYRALLNELELKKAEVVQVHDQYAFGYAKVVLAQARDAVQREIDALLNLELMPVPTVVNISTTISSLELAVGNTEQLVIIATYTDGSTRDVSAGFKAVATFRDADEGGYNNVGFITNVDASGYRLPISATIKVVKTTQGWNVYSKERLGLSLIETENENEYSFVDIDGEEIGLTFTTNGNEEKGDNWIINVDVRETGTIYETSDESVVAVDLNGMVFAIGEGEAEITITNNGSTIVIPVTVTVA
jgi:hypothetical protein